MLLTIPKKIVVAPPPVELISPFAELIDRVGRLREEAAPIQAKIKELEEQLKPLKKAEGELQQAIDCLEMPDDADDVEELGLAFKVEVGKKGSKRAIKDMTKVVELMGEELFLKLAKVSLTDIDAYLSPPQKDEVLAITRTSRGYKLTKRPMKKLKAAS